jgi:hypothetical protein
MTPSIDEHLTQLLERSDDWSAASFWYEPLPSAPLPPLPDAAARGADLCPTADATGAGRDRGPNRTRASAPPGASRQRP